MVAEQMFLVKTTMAPHLRRGFASLELPAHGPRLNHHYDESCILLLLELSSLFQPLPTSLLLSDTEHNHALSLKPPSYSM